MQIKTKYDSIYLYLKTQEAEGLLQVLGQPRLWGSQD